MPGKKTQREVKMCFPVKVGEFPQCHVSENLGQKIRRVVFHMKVSTLWDECVREKKPCKFGDALHSTSIFLLLEESDLENLRLHLLPFGLFCISALWWLPLMTDPVIGHATAKFLLLVLPDLAAQCIWRPMNRILASQRITCPFMIVHLGWSDRWWVCVVSGLFVFFLLFGGGIATNKMRLPMVGDGGVLEGGKWSL